MAKVTKTFADLVLAPLNKTEKEIQKEEVEDKIVDFTIELTTQITLLDAQAKPTQEQAIKARKRELEKAVKDLENCKLNILGKSFESYIDSINKAQRYVSASNSALSNAIAKLDEIAEQHKQMTELLEMFKS